jgi:hypothetical protein
MRPETSNPQVLHPIRAFIDVHAVGDTTIIPGVPGTNIRLYKFVLTAEGTGVITLKEGQRENSGGLRVVNNGNIVLMFESEMPLAVPAGQSLVLNLTTAMHITGFVEYTQRHEMA